MKTWGLLTIKKIDTIQQLFEYFDLNTRSSPQLFPLHDCNTVHWCGTHSWGLTLNKEPVSSGQRILITEKRHISTQELPILLRQALYPARIMTLFSSACPTQPTVSPGIPVLPMTGTNKFQFNGIIQTDETPVHKPCPDALFAITYHLWTLGLSELTTTPAMMNNQSGSIKIIA